MPRSPGGRALERDREAGAAGTQGARAGRAQAIVGGAGGGDGQEEDRKLRFSRGAGAERKKGVGRPLQRDLCMLAHVLGICYGPGKVLGSEFDRNTATLDTKMDNLETPCRTHSICVRVRSQNLGKVVAV